MTNQKSSGRCWIFACLNVIRAKCMSHFKVDTLEFSQNYLFFWDKVIILFVHINIRENWRRGQEWTTQRHRQQWAQNIEWRQTEQHRKLKRLTTRASPNKRGRGLNPDTLEGKTVSVSYRTADVLLDVHSGKRLVLMIEESQSLHKSEMIHFIWELYTS